MTPVVPFRSSRVSSDLTRAAEYHEGRRLTDGEVVDVLMREVEAMLAHWTALGKWMRTLDDWGTLARPRLQGRPKNNPSEEARARRSLSMRRYWTRRKALEMRRGA